MQAGSSWRNLPAFIAALRGRDADLVFPSPQRGKAGEARALSVMAFKPLLGRMGIVGITGQGFRSTFRACCSERARADREPAEAALSHATGNAVERAYARSDLFERRRVLIDAWGRFCLGRKGKAWSSFDCDPALHLGYTDALLS